MSTVGEPHDGRVLLMRDRKVLLNRNHPTIRRRIEVASLDEDRARILLDILLATDPHLSKETDPRQVEWDLLNRSEKYLEGKSFMSELDSSEKDIRPDDLTGEFELINVEHPTKGIFPLINC